MSGRSILFSVCAALVVSTIVSECDAQVRSPQRLGRRIMQWSGYGWGPGYHSCNPGPNTDYYNTWTRQNSFLLSELYPSEGIQGRSNYGIPYSVYMNDEREGVIVSPQKSATNGEGITPAIRPDATEGTILNATPTQAPPASNDRTRSRQQLRQLQKRN